MVGSPGNPVRFANPFQRITGVGWPNDFISVTLTLSGTVDIGFEGFCSPDEDLDPPYWNVWMTRWNLDFTNTIVNIIRPSTTQGITLLSNVSGVPEPNSPEFGAWEVVANTGATQGFGVHGVKGRWVEPSVDFLEIPQLPEVDDFYDTTQIGVIGRGDVFTGSETVCRQGQPSRQCTGNDIGVEPIHFNAQDYGGQTINFSGMSVEYRDNTFLPIGLKITSAGGVPNPNVGTVQILFQKQTIA